MGRLIPLPSLSSQLGLFLCSPSPYHAFSFISTVPRHHTHLIYFVSFALHIFCFPCSIVPHIPIPYTYQLSCHPLIVHVCTIHRLALFLRGSSKFIGRLPIAGCVSLRTLGCYIYTYRKPMDTEDEKWVLQTQVELSTNNPQVDAQHRHPN